MKKKLSILSVIFLLCMVAWIGLSLSTDNQSDKESLSEIQLGSIRDDLELWELSDNLSNSELREKLTQSILRKVILIRSVSPDITKIKGEGLETLCVLSENTQILDSVNDSRLVEIAKQYLSSVEAEVKDKIIRFQKNMKGEGCLISPDP